MSRIYVSKEIYTSNNRFVLFLKKNKYIFRLPKY